MNVYIKFKNYFKTLYIELKIKLKIIEKVFNVNLKILIKESIFFIIEINIFLY